MKKRLEYLGMADFDYLAARLLMIHGLVTVALPKAAEAVEKLMKLFLVLEAKISRNENLTAKDLKGYGHDLERLFAQFKTKVPVTFGGEWDDYVKCLQESYTYRYPEHWTQYRAELDLDKLDFVYVHMRNNIILNFPLEERQRVRHFGTFLYDAYTAEAFDLIGRLGGKNPGEILRLSNQQFALLDIDASRI
ncbi:hypothetical protein [Paludisphaera rhizosphaerae]|uniref:hypothetical protein n=1 Tax=Paludisphaera rhizosphaerae TaxID=2711216 RepID=UPI0013ECB192|nr:hypothetical protein [Paludisphaera rhizosphaerae]